MSPLSLIPYGFLRFNFIISGLGGSLEGNYMKSENSKKGYWICHYSYKETT